MKKLNKLLNDKPESPTVSGTWYAIRWQPDLATGENFNIGVGVKLSDGATHIQVLDSFERIEYLFSKETVFHAQLACEVAKEYILEHGFTENISPQIQCQKRGFTQGRTVSDILESLYKSVVTLGKKGND